MKSVRIVDLKNHLSEHLRNIRKGASLIVLDRQTPIAKIIPFATQEPFRVHAARNSAPLNKITLPKALSVQTDAVALLLKDRAGQ